MKAFIRYWTLFLTVILVLLLITQRLSFYYANQQIGWFDWIAEENGIWETVQALALILATGILVYGCWHYHSRFHSLFSFIAPLIFGALFFFAAGEEVNWGQFWFKFYPDISFDIHNHDWAGGHLDDVANSGLHWLIYIYGILLPLLAAIFPRVKTTLYDLCLPIPPLAFVPFCLFVIFIDYGWFYKHVLQLPYFPPPWSNSELRETLFDLVILGSVIVQYLRWREGSATP